MFSRYITFQVYRLVATLFCSGFLCLASIAQPGIRGTISEAKAKKIARASVELLSAKDSSLVKGALADEDGRFLFKNIGPGHYLFSSSYTGFKKAYSSMINFDAKKDFFVTELQLAEFSKELKAITIQAKKPLFEQKIDRMVVNVQSTITAAGSTALDVLERSPGIIVDRQNNAIIMGGKDGVVIMINGKINRMPADAVVQLLSAMSANNIEKIELITTPPSNFNAEGNAGYINIVFKNNPDFGTNGSSAIAFL